MGKYSCKICKKGSFYRSGLTQHVNMVHDRRRTLSQGLFEDNPEIIQASQRSVQDENLWKTLIFLRPFQISTKISSEMSTEFFAEMPEEIKEVESDEVEEAGPDEVEEVELDEDNTIEIGTSSLAVKSLSHYNLRSSSTIETSLETMEDNISDSSDGLSSANLEDIKIDLEDLQGKTFEDAMKAIKEKNKLEKVINWPNNAYHDFMELIIDGNISNKI